MLTLRPAAERGVTRLPWLDSRHSFSFADYHDPRHMGFRTLRVINDDRIAPSGGFGTHPHRDMEILTFVLAGELAHGDSLGNGSVIRPGEVQRMTAGRGVLHSEVNPSADEAVRLLQVWILPERRGLDPGYEQRRFPDRGASSPFQLLASRDGRDGSVTIHQDADVFRLVLAAGESAAFDVRPGRGIWIQAARGLAEAGGTRLADGDGAAAVDAGPLVFTAPEAAELLVFDLGPGR